MQTLYLLVDEIISVTSVLLALWKYCFQWVCLSVHCFIYLVRQTRLDTGYFTIKVSVSGATFCITWIFITDYKSFCTQNYTSLFTAYILSAFSVHCASCYASQSSSSVFECKTGSGGITSDILANAPPVPLGASPVSPPAGPFPDIPAMCTWHINCLLTPASHPWL